jgi:hypothetical protein
MKYDPTGDVATREISDELAARAPKLHRARARRKPIQVWVNSEGSEPLQLFWSFPQERTDGFVGSFDISNGATSLLDKTSHASVCASATKRCVRTGFPSAFSGAGSQGAHVAGGERDPPLVRIAHTGAEPAARGMNLTPEKETTAPFRSR